MPLFQNSVVSKYLQTLDKTTLNTKWEDFKSYFHNLEIQGNIKNSKEEQFQEGFLRELFVKILGYTLNPEPNFNLTTEYKNVKDSKKADGAILFDNKVKAVIELKGTDTTDLGKIETQAFGYKNNQPDCTYVITSNFEKIRLYIDNAIEHIEFNLFLLTQDEFNLLFLLIGYENLKNGFAKKVKEESISQEDKVTKKLYKDYSVFKRVLYHNLVELNPKYDALTLFKKSQKLLDRFLFLFFAEDRLLLPPNSVRLILNDWKDLIERDVEVSLYERFKQYFGYLNTGYKGKRYNVFAYNGGLFKPDPILDVISIDDNLLFEHTNKLSEYDFESEVDVNILGHIFENSLNEIEEIQAELEGQTIDKSKTKRKKDGVFYTPKYITKYIVENTVGKLCEEKRNELDITDEAYQPAKQRSRKRLENLQSYRDWLLQLTICDPACGSGAFLNEALNFLIAQHKYIDELSAKYNKDALMLSDVENSILENNLYGVDLNEESVEIAKLSLWLRTAQPNRKLNDLSNNIKCGNSLIDDPEIAGEKSFNWHKEFPHIFKKGGFDVIIGNPPYVRLESIKDISTGLEKMRYQTYEKRGDLYCLFVERGINILKQNGAISYIMPNKWLQASYGKPLREFVLNYEIRELIDFGDFQIFDGATTYPCIFIIKKDCPKEEINISVLKENNKADFYTEVLKSREVFKHQEFTNDTWVISSRKNKELLEKLNSKYPSLFEFINGDANYGVKTGLSDAFFISETEKNSIIKWDEISKNIIFPFVQGREITRYGYIYVNNYLIGTFPSFNLDIENYKGIKNHLLKFGKERLEQSGKKGSRKKSNNKWFETQDTIGYYKNFEGPKIMYQVFQVKPNFIFDEQGLYCNNSMWIIPSKDKGLLAILNSKMGWWLITQNCTQIQNGYQLIWKYFGQIPIPNTSTPLAEKAEQMLSLNKQKQELSLKFQRTLQRKFDSLDKLSKNMESWYNLPFSDFIKELKKKKISLSLSDEADWEDYFLQEQQKALGLQSKINQIDKEIDKMVYNLYGLTEEEIEIVENNQK